MSGTDKAGTYGRVYKAVLLPGPKIKSIPHRQVGSASAASVAVGTEHHRHTSPNPATLAADPLNNPELRMRPGDLSAKEGDVFAIKKFKPDKEGDVMTYAGISQSAAREIMVGMRIIGMWSVAGLDGDGLVEEM